MANISIAGATEGMGATSGTPGRDGIDFQTPNLSRRFSQISKSGANAILLTHGWNGSANAWPTQMGWSICDQLEIPYQQSSPVANDFTLVCSGNNWDVWLLDWSLRADTGLFNPQLAFDNAYNEGIAAAARIAPLNYNHLHLLAHSAGSNLISSIATQLKVVAEAQDSILKPFVHATFFDAYDPYSVGLNNNDRSFSNLGEDADAIDNYIDTRDLGANFAGLDKTQNIIYTAFNVEVQRTDTALPLYEEPDFFDFAGLVNQFNRLHNWPHVYYRNSINNPGYQLGFQLSFENGFLSPLLGKATKLCVINNPTDTCIYDDNARLSLVRGGDGVFIGEVPVFAPVAFEPSTTPGDEIANASEDTIDDQAMGTREGYVFSRTDTDELRWISLNDSNVNGSIWIDEVCAQSLGGPTVFGDWFELTELAPAQDTITDPCGTSPTVTESALGAGYVFSRTDVDELRWITMNSDGTSGSVWIAQDCANLLGGATVFGDWFDLTARAPAQDTVDSPCN